MITVVRRLAIAYIIIRKVRGTMFKKIRKKLLAALTDKAEKQQPMTLLEKEFLRERGLTVDNGTKNQFNR